MLKKIKLYAVVLVLVVGMFPLHSQADEQSIKQNDLYAMSALLMDADNGRVLYEKNGYDIMPMASTTKIMTCIVTLENSNLDDIVTVSKYAASMPDVQLGIRTDEQYQLRDLIYALMLESSNDAAVAIAEHVSGSVEDFCNMMTKKANELGAFNTAFKTPNGLDADGHETTAYDLALIARYAIENEEFIAITNETSRSFKDIAGKRSFSISNKNSFLHLMDGAIGVKTGFTNKAGYCFVGALERDGKKFISVVLASGWPPNKSYKWHDTKVLMNYGLNNYEFVQLFDKNKEFDKIFVDKGKEKFIEVILEGDIELLLKVDEETNILYELPDKLTAPVKKGEVIGYAKYFINNELYMTLPIKTTSNIEKIDYRFCLDQILEKWLGK